MKITVVPAHRLTSDHVAAWTTLQGADKTVDSPFFRPEYTQAVAQARSGIEVAVLEHGGALCGFFPYQRRYSNVGRPVGGPISDFQGLIARPGLAIDPKELIRSCRLSAWHFDHLIAAQAVFGSGHWSLAHSPYVDISRGFEAYRSERREAGSDALVKTFQKMRKLEREVGAVRFEFATKDERILQTLVDWKTRQNRRSLQFNMFSTQWTNRLFRRLLARTDVGFSGALSALYVNDELAAALYWMRSNRVLHAWVTAYNPALAKYSPGSQLFTRVVQAACEAGIERIDLGKGNERYKASLMTGATPLAVGSIDSRPMTRSVRYAWHRLHSAIGESSLRRPLTIPWRFVKGVVQEAQFR
jgi:CelD/BcsL family acetyltransferase involved in cellulose biosynthesis